MNNRLKLQEKLEMLLGSRNVYYQPPESVKMEYPAIVYSKNNISGSYANDSVYATRKVYNIIVIDKKPDNPVIEELLKLPYCSFNTHYKANNLNHDSFTIYI